MMPQGAKDSRSHACMEERLPLAPAPAEVQPAGRIPNGLGFLRNPRGIISSGKHPRIGLMEVSIIQIKDNCVIRRQDKKCW